MKGYRTIIVNMLMMIGAVAGLNIDPQTALQYADAFVLLWGGVNMALRWITTGPIGTHPPDGKVVALLLAVGVILSLATPLGACSTGVVMPGPIADATARSPLHQVASGRANLNAMLAAAAVYVQSGQATGQLTDTVRDLSASAAAAVDKADAVATAGASQTVVTVILAAAHRDLRELAAAMAKEVRGSVLALIATASVERGLDLGSNLAIGATAAAHTRLTAWETEGRDPTAAEMAALSAETESLLAIIRGE